MAKEMICDLCDLKFGNNVVLKLHLKLVHNVIKEDEEMTLVKTKERQGLLYFWTQTQILGFSSKVYFSPEGPKIKGVLPF